MPSLGGVYFAGGTNHQILNSTFSANSAATRCGAFYNNTTLNVTNTTISGNSASKNAGGGFYNGGGMGASVTLRSVTVTGNSATNGGGIYHFNGALNLGNTIVAGNMAASNSDIFFSGGTITTAGYNLIGNNSSVETAFPAGNPNAISGFRLWRGESNGGQNGNFREMSVNQMLIIKEKLKCFSASLHNYQIKQKP